MASSTAHVPPFHQIVWKLVEQFLHNPANKQTNKLTNADENITLVEVITGQIRYNPVVWYSIVEFNVPLDTV